MADIFDADESDEIHGDVLINDDDDDDDEFDVPSFLK